jgi:hypothetical protein
VPNLSSLLDPNTIAPRKLNHSMLLHDPRMLELKTHGNYPIKPFGGNCLSKTEISLVDPQLGQISKSKSTGLEGLDELRGCGTLCLALHLGTADMSRCRPALLTANSLQEQSQSIPPF